jgi:glycosyltransferase involved in cell wall biosynthesis
LKNIAYLCSEFPALSHTFISREVAILEKSGFDIRYASINPTRNLEKMDADDQARAAATYVLKATPKGRMLRAFLACLLRLPRFLSTLGFALKLAGFGGPRQPAKALAYFLQAILLHRWARGQGLKHVHVHFANPAATVALIACRFGGLEFSLSVHGPDEFYEVERNNLREKIQAAVFVRCISHFCRSQLMRLSPSDQWGKFHIVRCGLLPGEIAPRPAATGPRRRILCVGRLCPSKGQAILIQAAGLLKDRGADFQLLLLGGGEDLEAIQGLVATRGLADRVTVAGPVGHARVRQELEAADLFVLPSFAEGIPIALMEAMAAGVPVLSTMIAGIPELIQPGVNGFLVPASDAEGLAEAIAGILGGSLDLGALVESAHGTVWRDYDVERNTQSLGRLFAGLPD